MAQQNNFRKPTTRGRSHRFVEKIPLNYKLTKNLPPERVFSFSFPKKVVEILIRIKKGLLHWWRDQCHQEQSLSTEYNYKIISLSTMPMFCGDLLRSQPKSWK